MTQEYIEIEASQQYGVSKTTIRNVVKDITWKHLLTSGNFATATSQN